MQFFKATSSAALESGMCSICAHEHSLHDDGLSKIYLDHLPNTNCLVPQKAHPTHDLFNGKLLELSIIQTIERHYSISICSWCSNDLKKLNDKPLHYALANQLWIGQVLWQLQVLTFPKQLLISLIYLCIFIFKLFSKQSGVVWDMSSLQYTM